MRTIKKKWKSEKFRPEIPDSSGEFRREYFDVCQKSGLTLVAFNRKVSEAGLAMVKQQITK